jgi:predicted peroxiredoxin
VSGQPVLVLISEDPRASHRAHEAMRIALGVAASDNDVSIVLSGDAAHLLDDDTDDLVDGDDVQKVRASLKKLGIAFHVETSARPADPSWNADGHLVVAVEPAGIAALATRATRFIVF